MLQIFYLTTVRMIYGLIDPKCRNAINPARIEIKITPKIK